MVSDVATQVFADRSGYGKADTLREHDQSLATRGFVAFMWGAGGTLVRMALQLGAQIVLARILGPEVYGLFALGLLIVSVSNYFADFGLAYGLIQKTNVTREDIQFVWTWQCLLGLAVALTMWASAGVLAQAFAKPAVEPVFAWLSLACLLNALAAPSTNLLKKALDYKALQVAQLAGYVVGYILVGVPLALSDAGIYSLVAAIIVQGVVSLAILYGHSPHSLAFRVSTSGGGAMLRYGVTVLATNLINWLLSSADKLMVGRIFPAHVVGLYNTAFNIVNAPATAAYANLQSVVFSACARLQGDVGALRAVYRRLLAAVGVAAFPLFAVLGMGADIAVAAIYGPAWTDAAQYLRIFAFASPCLLLWGIATPILWNTGNTRMELNLQLPLVILWCAVLLIAATRPPSTFALAAACLLGLRASVMAIVAARILTMPFREIAGALAGGAVLTGLMVAACGYALVPAARLISNPQAQLAWLLMTGALAFAAALLVLGPWVIDRPLAGILVSASSKLPRSAARLVRFAARERRAA